MISRVTIDIQASFLSDEYDYIIPDELLDYVKVGSRVLVEFGVRKVLGYVIDIKEKTDFKGNLRPIIQVLDYNAELSAEQVILGKQIAHEIKCSLCAVLSAMIPPFLKSKYRKFISIKNYNEIDPHIVTLFNEKKKITLTNEIIKEYPRIKKEIEKGNISLDFDIYSYGKTKKIKKYFVNKATSNIYEKYTGTRKKIIDYLIKRQEATIDELKEFVGCSNYIVKALQKEEILGIIEYPVTNVQKQEKVLLKNKEFDFDGNIIKQKYNEMSNKPFLLYSNDEKFTLDFYLDICIDNIQKNKKTLVVAPTLIAYYNIFYYLRRNLEGYEVINFSSDMPNNEYYENYMKAKNGEAQVCVCTKAGIFTPLDDIGTIIVYDESNYNYLCEMTPKYNAIEVLKARAVYHDAKIVLTSFPPTIENYYHYYLADYNLLRYVKPLKYKAKKVNMYNETINNRQVISYEMEEAINNALQKNKQVMLILNNKGYSQSLKCRKCGKVATCEKCNIPLTYYKEKNEYKCRYCGKVLESLECKCGCDNYSTFGMGLELVKEKLELLFPLSNILLLDSNNMREFEDYQNAVVRIESGEANIIIGTTNVIGLARFANLDMIGLVSVDSILNYSDFKASYYVFSLIYNALNKANVIIQGYNLEHYSIEYAINGDFNGFYNAEIKAREMFNYPPFSEINKIIITGDYKDIYYCANYFKKVYSSITKTQNMVLGPTYVKLKKGVQLIIKSKDYEKLFTIIDEVKNKFKNTSVVISYERYPRSL